MSQHERAGLSDPEVTEVLAIAKSYLECSAFNLGRSSSRNAQRSARDYQDVADRIAAILARASTTAGENRDG